MYAIAVVKPVLLFIEENTIRCHYRTRLFSKCII